MAARDAKFNNYLKKALKNKLHYPEATSFLDGEYFYDYDFIFQQARLVLPQKYGIQHSYLNGTPISDLNKQQLNQLNLKFAHSVIDAWGGLEENQTDTKYLDPVLAEYESPETAPDESDFFHQQLETHKLTDESPAETPQSETPHFNIPHPSGNSDDAHLPPPPQPPAKPPLEETIAKTRRSMAQTKQTLNQPAEAVPPQLSEKNAQRLSRANRAFPKPIAPSTTPPSRITKLNSLNRALQKPRPLSSSSSPIRKPIRSVNPPRRLPSPLRSLGQQASSSAQILGRKGLSRGIGIGGSFLGSLPSSLGSFLGLGGPSSGRNGRILPQGFSNRGSFSAGSSSGGGIKGLAKKNSKKWLLWLLLLSWITFVMFDSTSEEQTKNVTGCPADSVSILKEVVGATKEDKFFRVDDGQTINYAITVSMTKDCGKDFIIEDTLTGNGQIDTASVSDGGVVSGKKITWALLALPAPKKLTYSVIPESSGIWLINQVKVSFSPKGSTSGTSQPLNLTGPSRGLICIPGLDERLLRIFEEAGIAANVSPSMLYSIAKAENGGHVPVYSLDGKEARISHCGAHGLMQIQHINDGKGRNYAASCAAAGDSPNPPETWDGLAAKYNEISGGNLVDPDSDKDSIFGAAFYIKDRGWPSTKGYVEQLTDAEAASIARQYLGGGGYAAQAVNSYKDAFAKQGTCGGQMGAGGVTQPVPGGVNAE